MCKIVSNILLSRLSPQAEEISGDHQCGPGCNGSTTDLILCNHQILEKKWKYNKAVHQPLMDFKKAYNSVRREILYNILSEYVIPKKLVRIIKMCLNEIHCRVQVGKYFSAIFPVRNGLKKGDALQPLLFNCASKYAIRRVEVNQNGLKFNDMYQLLVYDDINIFGFSNC